jgi:hypothetical protein
MKQMRQKVAEEKLRHFVSEPDKERVKDNALQAFDYNLYFPLPRYKATCRRCKHKPTPADELQLSRFHTKKNDDKQFPCFLDLMMKCTRCSCVEAWGLLPGNIDQHLQIIEEFEHYVVEWRDVLERNKAYLEEHD